MQNTGPFLYMSYLNDFLDHYRCFNQFKFWAVYLLLGAALSLFLS
jgi:hypothetical protein